MSPCEKSEEDVPRGLGPIQNATLGERNCGSPLIEPFSLLEARERDLPPLPDEDGCNNEISQPNDCRPPSRGATHSNSSSIPIKIPLPSLTPSLSRPTKHDLIFPTYHPNTPLQRPQLRLETGWGSLRFPVHIHSADDVSTASFKSSSQQSLRSTTSQDKLLSSSEDLPFHQTSSIQDAYTSRNKKSSNCRFLGAMRLPKIPSVRTAHTKALTTRSIDHANNTMISKPFMRSDGNPLHGITVTVHRQQLVSEPMPAFSSLSTTSLGASTLSLDKPLPNPGIRDAVRDLPAIPAPSDDQPKSADPIADDPNTSVPDSNSLSPAVVHVARRPSGAKRRKHYKIHRVPVPPV
ncbi:hypothetical protein C8R44DRAFT_884714 [Mycena epipterygia]|nr:hypothetical protein C8R44DRAFT_884714 [Mycena epipterygia]